MNKAILHVPPVLLFDVLRVPKETEFIGAVGGTDGSGNLVIFLSHPDFPETQPGNTYPTVNVQWKYTGESPPEFDRWVF